MLIKGMAEGLRVQAHRMLSPNACRLTPDGIVTVGAVSEEAWNPRVGWRTRERAFMRDPVYLTLREESGWKP
jgi:hypothetical protein